jgi:hypothetical protein
MRMDVPEGTAVVAETQVPLSVPPGVCFVAGINALTTTLLADISRRLGDVW